MKVAIYWEQDSWGGVDSHLLELLSTWPIPQDQFVLFHNRGNTGFERIRVELEGLSHVRTIAVSSSSHNEMTRRVRALPGSGMLRALLYCAQPITFLVMVWRLSREFATAGPFDAMLADNGGYPASWGCLSALCAARKADIRARVLLVHHAATRPALFMGWYERLVDRTVSGTASAVVCVSHATRQSLLDNRAFDAHDVRLRVIHNGMSADRPAATSATRVLDVRRESGARDELLAGIVGRVEPYKGHDDVMFALARLPPESRRRLRLVVIGAGEEPEVARLRRVARNLSIDQHVSFTGYLPGRSIDLIAGLDLLIVATRGFEGFGLTVIEAMHVGTPVLATRAGAIPEFVDESIGMLVNPGAPDEISVALDDFLSNRDAWRRRAVCAQQRVQQTGDRMAREYRQMFVECLAAQ